MEEIKIINVNDIHTILGKYKMARGVVFRGQANADWELIPKAGRPPFTVADDHFIFRHWKRRAKAYLERELYTEWELLAIAQHTGLPTRLLDWTYNPLIAFFFACIDEIENDGAVFCYASKSLIRIENTAPFDTKKGIGYFQPASSSHRIINQFAHFTIHNPASVALNNRTKYGVLEKLTIDKNIKNDVILMLNQYGINYLSLFPDLEGLSRHLGWFVSNFDSWKTDFGED